jgi:hypothetical protein
MLTVLFGSCKLLLASDAQFDGGVVQPVEGFPEFLLFEIRHGVAPCRGGRGNAPT